MKTIIEKLGIERLESQLTKCGFTFDEGKVRELEQQRDDLLEAIIQIKIILNKVQNEDLQIKAIAHILNAERLADAMAELITGLSWQQIKHLMDTTP